MFLSHHYKARQFVLRCCFLLLVLGLAACSSAGGSQSSSSSSSIAHPPTATPTATTKTYTSASFSLSYPQNWLVQGSGNQVIFQDAQGLNALTVIITPNPRGVKSAQALADTTFPLVEKAILANAQSVPIASTVALGSETWIQRGAAGLLSSGGQSVPGKLVMLVSNHPAQAPTTHAYEIYYGGPAATFDQKENAIFQTMLQSLTF